MNFIDPFFLYRVLNRDEMPNCKVKVQLIPCTHTVYQCLFIIQYVNILSVRCTIVSVETGNILYIHGENHSLVSFVNVMLYVCS